MLELELDLFHVVSEFYLLIIRSLLQLLLEEITAHIHLLLEPLLRLIGSLQLFLKLTVPLLQLRPLCKKLELSSVGLVLLVLNNTLQLLNLNFSKRPEFYLLLLVSECCVGDEG
jgi:hypothetical protein